MHNARLLEQFHNFSAQDLSFWLNKNQLTWNLKAKTLDIVNKHGLNGKRFLQWKDDEMAKVLTTVIMKSN